MTKVLLKGLFMAKQRIQLSDHFTYSRLLRFVLPCIGTMLFTSIYGIVDGLCVSNFVGKTAFAAVNLIMPLPMLLGTIGFMLGTGGSAIVGITLGEGDQKKADRYFTMFMLAALVSVSVLAVLGIVFLRPIAVLLGAKGELLDYALRYGRILMVSLPTFALQNMFQSFFVTAEKPHLGFYFTVGAGCTNMVLDVLLVGAGQAVATCPGISRSGMTITTGCFMGFERKFAVRFSFLLSIPAVLGANILSLKDAIEAGIVWAEVPMYLVGVVTAAVVGYVCIRLLRMVAEKGRFGAFAYYCWAAGLLTLLLNAIK